MTNYPEVVATIANDYLRRVQAHLQFVPALERDEFLREIQSHLYEAYQRTPGEDDVTRILSVLRNLGEPAEVVADRLPGAMVRSGTKRNLPLYVAGGIFIALFGIPLGFGGIGVLIGLLGALAGVLVAYFATAGSILLVGALLMLLGLIRFATPHFWDTLIAAGVLRMDGPPGEFLNRLAPSEQGLLLILGASVLVAAGLGMLWVGRHLFRGLRFLSSMLFDWMRKAGARVRKELHRDHSEGASAPNAWFAPLGSSRSPR